MKTASELSAGDRPRLRFRSVALLVASVVAIAIAVTFAASCARAPMHVSAPARIAQALALVDELEATATLVLEGGGPEATVDLSRGADGVTFSGFIDAKAGTYVLEIVFTGIPTDVEVAGPPRHFLGRLTSNSFTVVDGASTTPTFSTAIDTIGRTSDGGDEDADGLGFLDELLVGANPDDSDSDDDGLADGSDCRPGDEDSTFAIVEDGSFEDCDGDGFRSLDSPFGPRGNDCNDEAAETNPLADDDCATNENEDCNEATCPLADGLGPEIDIVTPLPNAPIGCNAPFVIEAVDPSDVLSAHMTAPDDDLPGSVDRFVQLLDDGDGLTFRATNGFGETGALADGPLHIDVSAIDTAANLATVGIDVFLEAVLPVIEIAGPSTILDDAVDLTVTVTHDRTIVSAEVRAAPYNASTGIISFDDEIVMHELDAVDVASAGVTVSIDPEALPDDFVVYAVAVDDIGNAASPSRFASFDPVAGIEASFSCDGAEHTIPAVARRRDLSGPVTALTFLAEATSIARDLQPTSYLAQIRADGIDADGRVDLSRTDRSVSVSYKFMTPEAVANSSDPEGVSVTWFSAFDGVANPVVNPTGAFQIDEITNPEALPDSDVVAPLFAASCLGNPPSGQDDSVSYLNDGDGSLFPVGSNYVAVDTEQGHSWTQMASDLDNSLGFCCDPDCS